MASMLEGLQSLGGADFQVGSPSPRCGHDGNRKASRKCHQLNGEDDLMLNL